MLKTARAIARQQRRAPSSESKYRLAEKDHAKMSGSLRQPRGGKRLREHGLHGIGDIGWRVGGKEKARRSALLHRRRDGRNDRIDLAVFVAEKLALGGDRLIGM